MKPDAATKQDTAALVGVRRGLGWVVACTVSAALGIAVARPMAELVRQPLSQVVDGLPTVALFGAVLGGCVALGQALVWWGRSGPHPAWWVVGTSVGGAVGYVLGIKLATAVTDPMRGKVLVSMSEALGYLVLGAVLGLLVGIAQGGVWRARGQGMVSWIVRTILGWALGFVVAAGVGLLITRLPSVTARDLLFGGLAGLTVGSLEAPVVAAHTGI